MSNSDTQEGGTERGNALLWGMMFAGMGVLIGKRAFEFANTDRVALLLVVGGVFLVAGLSYLYRYVEIVVTGDV